MLKKLFQPKQRGDGGGDFAAAVRRADQARDSGDHGRAATLYRQVLDGWGPNFGMLVQLGNALKDSGAHDEAKQAYFAALQLEPLDADCHLQLGHLMKLADKPGAALGYYGDAHRLDPTLPDALREIRALEDTAFMAAHADRPRPQPAERTPERMRVETVDRGDRARLMRERFTEGLRWRRD